jgi:hypothetical protein
MSNDEHDNRQTDNEMARRYSGVGLTDQEVDGMMQHLDLDQPPQDWAGPKYLSPQISGHVALSRMIAKYRELIKAQADYARLMRETAEGFTELSQNAQGAYIRACERIDNERRQPAPPDEFYTITFDGERRRVQGPNPTFVGADQARLRRQDFVTKRIS